MLKHILTVTAALAVVAPSLTLADDDQGFLTVGDPAPEFSITHWLKGDALERFEPGKVYVFEFWATWCGPCVGQMEHVSALQSEYKDYGVTVVGVSDEPLQTVVDFLFKEYKRNGKIQNDRIQYTLATDPDESVKKSYFEAAGQNGIPCAFIIGKEQRIEWIGHPASLDEPLGAVVRDAWDREAFKARWEEEQEAHRAMVRRQKALMEAHTAKDWPRVIALLDEMSELAGGDPGYQVEKFRVIAKNIGDYDRAYALAGRIVDESWDNAQMLNNVAWFIVDEQGLERRDLELAMKAAKRANELTDDQDGPILDTVARVYFEKGDLETALRYQRKAVEHAEQPMLQELKATLEKYERLAEKGT